MCRLPLLYRSQLLLDREAARSGSDLASAPRWQQREVPKLKESTGTVGLEAVVRALRGDVRSF